MKTPPINDDEKGLSPADTDKFKTEPGTPISKEEAGTVRRLSWKVQAQEEGLTVEQFLRAHGCSHHILTHLKRTENGICRNGVWTYANQRILPGDRLDVTLTETENSAHILPVPLPLAIVYEDEDLLVINKPCGMPVHPSMGNYENTLANAVMYHCQGRPFVFRCINRLDRDTSGLLIIAKNAYSGAVLADCLIRRQIHRKYLAIAEGILPVSQTIDAPIARKPGSALMRCVDRIHGERAVTHIRRLACYEWAGTGERPQALQGRSSIPGQPQAACYERPDTQSQSLAADFARQKNLPQFLSLAAVCLETGRTHQIRVHLSYTGHPLPGDFLYNPPAAPASEALPARISRQALHSYSLCFPHPVTGEILSFRAPMPDDMQRLLAACQKLPF